MSNLFNEIFQETSVGDIGIEVANGPLIKCHTYVLEAECPGFLAKIRSCTALNRSVSIQVPVSTIQEEIKKDPRLERLKADLEFIGFSQDASLSCLGSSFDDDMKKLRKPGYSTATKMSGSIGSTRTRDVFFLAERYEINEPLEQVVELLRFVYRKKCAFLTMEPKTTEDKEYLARSMLDMMYLCDKYCVDELFTLVLDWIYTRSRSLCGDLMFADTYYQMEYYQRERCVEPLNKAQLKRLVLEMLSDRSQLQIVTNDSRWMSISPALLEEILSRDDLAIGAEAEIMGLIERWNGSADKSKNDIVQLLSCYRVSESTWNDYCRTFRMMGFPKPADDLLQKQKQLKPRDNLTFAQMSELMEQMAEEEKRAMQEAAKKRREERDAAFIQFEKGNKILSGFMFNLCQHQTIVSNIAVRKEGTYRARMAFSQSKQMQWDPAHELFTGIIYGNNKYHGYICGQSPYDGVYRVQSFTSAAPKPGAPQHFTGSGTKVEFDLELGVSMQRVNRVTICTLTVLANNTSIIDTDFEIRHDTLTEGTGLRFQIMGTIPPPGVVDVSMAWVGGTPGGV